MGMRFLRVMLAGTALVLSGAGVGTAADGPIAAASVRDVLNRSVSLLQRHNVSLLQ